MNDILKQIQSKIDSRILIDYDMKKSTWFRAGGYSKELLKKDAKVVALDRDSKVIEIANKLKSKFRRS